MARFGGGVVLKTLAIFLRGIELCCAAIILGIFSYYLATLHNHGLHIDTYIRAVEGISGVAVIYTLAAVLLVCCLGGIAFFAFLGVLLDIAFCGAFIYVAWATRGGASTCNGNVNTPFGSGNTNTNNSVSNGHGGVTILPSLHRACKLETATFAVAIVAIVFFLLSAFVEFFLARHHKKEKAFGPSPNNGYTAGSPKRKFWQRKNKNAAMGAGGLAAEKQRPDSLPAHTTPADARTSYATDTTAVGGAEPAYNKYGHNGAGHYQNQNSGIVGGTEVPGTDGYQRTHQPFNQNPSANY